MFYKMKGYQKWYLKHVGRILILLSLLFLIGCNNNYIYGEVMKEYSTDEEGLYNLYFFYGGSENSLQAKDEFSAWDPSGYLNVYNTRSYDISEESNEKNQTFIETLKISENDVPIFVMFNHTGIILKTDRFDDVLYYLDNRRNEEK